MRFVQLLRIVKAQYAWGLFKLFVVHPVYIWPTINATIRCLKWSNKLYKGQHHKDNVTNAFRHALWNFLLAKKARVWNRNTIKSMAWAKVVTDYHEDIMPNPPLQEAMDLHNNEIGRWLFENNPKIKVDEAVHKLQIMMEEAVKVSDIKQINPELKKLIYILDL